MGKNDFTSMSESLLSMGGQDNYRGDPSSSLRIIYAAVVRSTDDYAGFNRLKAEIVTLDENGAIKPGKDRDTPTDKLPICIPLLSEFSHIRPQVGEMVLVISENPLDLTSTRYWLGPVISQQTKLPYQSYTDASEIFNINNFSQKNTASNPTTNNLNKAAFYYPQPSDIALQGRQDADITFSPRSVLIRAGRFKKGTTDLNTNTPCQIEIKQVETENVNPNSIRIFDRLALSESTFVPYSQINFQSTNINIYSPEGKFKKPNLGTDVELSTRLKDFGSLADSLHPTVFGDELIILLRLILRFLITHVHTPQSPAVPNNLTLQLEPYLTGTKLQDLISNVVRIN